MAFMLEAGLRERLTAVTGGIPDLYIFVDTKTQKLSLISNSAVCADYPVSTSKFGIGSKEGSFKTPLGIHKVVEKIGAGAPAGRIFKDRKDTGRDWDGRPGKDNMILTQILRLAGLEAGINKGDGIILRMS